MNWNFGNIDFSTYPSYNEAPLGVTYAPKSTIFRLWAPTASRVLLRLYNTGNDEAHFNLIELIQLPHVWEIELTGDYHGVYYTVQCLINNNWMDEVPDPYAFAVGVNGKRAMICNFSNCNPAGWESDLRVLPNAYTDMVLYELHVRDFSVDAFSGISNKGKYLAFTEEGTLSPEGLKTGLDHLVELGITHVHLLPIYDFFTVNEAHPEKQEYNWGYDPLNYNSLEGSYSNNPFDGSKRITEFKLLVQKLHEKGIGVIMDVVYNHTGLIHHSYFNQTVPGYYYRQRANGNFSDASGCGTEIASERNMVRKFIIDSLKFWAEEYHLDGFRFDLMGVYDLATMNTIREEMDKIDPKLVLYGEGWTAAESPLSEKYRATKSNTKKLNRIAVFNDDFRDALKGHWGSSSSVGFASGQTLNEESVKFAIVGATKHPQINFNYIKSSHVPWADSPQKSINYISCHDNYTLYDKLKLSRPDANLHDLAKMVCLAGSILLTSQGVPFLHSGVEMMRTKKGHGNTYNLGDEYNMIDWSRKAMFSYVTSYFKKLIELRRKHPAFRMTSTEMIQKHLKFSDNYMTGVVAYELTGNANNDSWNTIQVIFNNNPGPIIFPVKKRKWTEVANSLAVDENGLSCHHSHDVFVQAVSMMILISE
ncbi:MAG: type I pullulanase [Prolixibacteraceae bacterium]